MNLEAFRIAWDTALRAAGLLASHDRAEDAVVLGTMARKYFVRLGLSHPRPADPFLGSLELSWEWDALQSARTRTTEDDLLTELLGRDQFGADETEPPWLRVDLQLHGKLAWDERRRVPGAEIWRAWVAEVSKRVAPLLPTPSSSEPWREGVVTWWTGEPEAQVRCGPEGELWLLGVALEGWQAIVLPRQCDHPDVPDEGPEAQLKELAEGLAAAFAAWNRSLRLLLPHAGRLH